VPYNLFVFSVAAKNQKNHGTKKKRINYATSERLWWLFNEKAVGLLNNSHNFSIKIYLHEDRNQRMIGERHFYTKNPTNTGFLR
jgi:hypothetical protein